MKKRQYTLIEILIVIAIIIILIAILLPTLSKAKEFAKDAHCKNNLKQQAVAFNTYATDNAGWYPMSAGFQGLENDRSKAAYCASMDNNQRWWTVNEPNRKPGRPAQNYLTFEYLKSAEVWACPSNRFSPSHPNCNWKWWKERWEHGIYFGGNNYDSSYAPARPLSSHGTDAKSDPKVLDGAGLRYLAYSHAYIGGNTIFLSIPEMPLSADIARTIRNNAYIDNSDFDIDRKFFNRFRHINHYNYSRVDGAVSHAVVKGRRFDNYTQQMKDAVVLDNSGSGHAPVFQGDVNKFWCGGNAWNYPGPSTCRWYSW